MAEVEMEFLPPTIPDMPQPSWERYILVVEDDPALRELYRSSLRAAGYAVVGVEDGQEALKLVHVGKPRAVVLDLGLPRLSGREVSKQLRSDATTEHIPVMIVTGSDTSDLDPSHFACVLKKPISPDDLVEAVQKCVTAPATVRGSVDARAGSD
jgi:CheY-like chemotaxis protein